MPSRLILLGSMFLQICYMYRKLKNRRTRRWKCRYPNNRNYFTQHEFSKNLREMDEEEFFHYFGMPRAPFELLLNMTVRELRKQRQLVSPKERLCLGLQFLAHGERLQTLARQYKINRSTTRKIILKTCEILWRTLAPEYINNRSVEQYKNIADGFNILWNVPNCVGAIDAKHIPIRCPPQTSGHMKVDSLILMGVCDTNYQFTAVNLETFGDQNDGDLFKTSPFGQALIKEKLPIPPNAPLSKESQFPFPYYFVDNAVFPLRSNVMRPYANVNLDETKRIFNYRISRAHQISENTFGILIARWKVLTKSMDFNPGNCECVVLACVVLHNFVMRHDCLRWYCPDYYVDSGDSKNGLWRKDMQRTVGPLKSVTSFNRRGPSNAIPLRDMLAKYFMNEGSIPSQENFFAKA